MKGEVGGCDVEIKRKINKSINLFEDINIDCSQKRCWIFSKQQCVYWYDGAPISSAIKCSKQMHHFHWATREQEDFFHRKSKEVNCFHFKIKTGQLMNHTIKWFFSVLLHWWHWKKRVSRLIDVLFFTHFGQGQALHSQNQDIYPFICVVIKLLFFSNIYETSIVQYKKHCEHLIPINFLHLDHYDVTPSGPKHRTMFWKRKFSYLALCKFLCYVIWRCL